MGLFHPLPHRRHRRHRVVRLPEAAHEAEEQARERDAGAPGAARRQHQGADHLLLQDQHLRLRGGEGELARLLVGEVRNRFRKGYWGSEPN